MGATNLNNKIDPFKTQKKKTSSSKSKTEVVEAPEEIQQAIDSFRSANEQMKHWEGEAAIHKEQVTQFARESFAKRFYNGQQKNFKILGVESTVTFVAMDKARELNEEEVEALKSTYGQNFIDEIIDQDLKSIKFNPETLEKHYDQIVGALQSLPEEILGDLFLPVAQKATKGALSKALKYVKDEEQFEQVVGDLKITNYVR